MVVTNLGAAVLYLGLGAISYYFIFDHDLMKHPQFLQNQVRKEIIYALTSLPWITIPTVVLFSAKVRGYSKLYDNISESPLGWPGLFLSMTFYMFFTDMCFYCIHRFLHHKLMYKNQVRREIKYALTSLPWISIPTVALFFAEVRGYSKLYDNVNESPLGWPGLFLSMISYVIFTDMCIYCIHRFLHHRLMYKPFHKPHHIWKIPTPFASHAIHLVDAFLQGLPYHIYPFLFPLHKLLYLLLYVFVNIWAISIHDGNHRVPRGLTAVICGSAHHTDHHLFFDYNYGQYFTLWDRLGGSYRHPSGLMGKGPHDLIRKLQAEGKLGGDKVKGKGQLNGHSLREVTHKEE